MRVREPGEQAWVSDLDVYSILTVRRPTIIVFVFLYGKRYILTGGSDSCRSVFLAVMSGQKLAGQNTIVKEE